VVSKISLRCATCGQKIVFPTWWDGKPHCLACAIRERAKQQIKEVRKRAKSN